MESRGQLLQKVAHPLGVRVAGGRMSAILDANTRLPVRKARTHAFVDEYESWTVFEIYEGDAVKVRHNRKLGELRVPDVPASPAGTEQIQVIMEIDADGLLHVSAKVVSTRQTVRVTIDPTKFCAIEQQTSGTSEQQTDYAKSSLTRAMWWQKLWKRQRSHKSIDMEKPVKNAASQNRSQVMAKKALIPFRSPGSDS